MNMATFTNRRRQDAKKTLEKSNVSWDYSQTLQTFKPVLYETSCTYIHAHIYPLSGHVIVLDNGTRCARNGLS